MSLEGIFKITKGSFKLDLKLKLPKQGVTVLFGPSGCGKTTLLRLISGLDKSANCKINFNGEVWQDQNTFLKPHQRPLAYVFQEGRLFRHLNARQNLEYGLHRTPEASRKLDPQQVIALLELETLLDRQIASLSGGQKQRIALGRALLTSPELLLMDEPLSALDFAAKEKIFPFLQKVIRHFKIPVLYVTHAMDEMARLADHIALMDNGTINAFAAAEEILSNLELWPMQGKLSTDKL